MNNNPSQKTLQEMEDEVLQKCLDEVFNHVAVFSTHFAAAVIACDAIQDLPCHSEEMKLKRRRALDAPIGMFKQCIQQLGGIPALIRFDKEGEGLLSNCIVLPTNPE